MRVSRYSLDTPAKSFVEVPYFVILGAWDQEPQQVRGAEYAFECF